MTGGGTDPGTGPGPVGLAAVGLLILGACYGPRPGRTSLPLEPPAAYTLVGRKVVVDPGHGGRDPGATGSSGLVEKDVNLAIARELADRLSERGATVLLTRKRDSRVSLEARANMADRTHCDLFVSIHADAAEHPGAHGATVFVARGALPASERVAASVEAALRAAGIDSRGVRSSGFQVLVGHSRPALLVECGFVTNPKEAALLATDAHRRRLARAIARGIEDVLTARAYGAAHAH